MFRGQRKHYYCRCCFYCCHLSSTKEKNSNKRMVFVKHHVQLWNDRVQWSNTYYSVKAAVPKTPLADLYYLFITMLTRWSYLHWRTCWYPLFCELKQQSCFSSLCKRMQIHKSCRSFFAASCLSLPYSRSHIPFLTSATACLEKWMFQRFEEPLVRLKG